MIPPDIVVEDLGENNWGRMTSLVAELLARDEDRAPNRKGPLLVVYNGLRLLKAVDLGSGMPVVTYVFALVAALAAAAIAMRLQQPMVTPAVVTATVHRVGVAMRRERHLPRVRVPRPAFLWMLLRS